jgi:hypothetical protein
MENTPYEASFKHTTSHHLSLGRRESKVQRISSIHSSDLTVGQIHSWPIIIELSLASRPKPESIMILSPKNSTKGPTRCYLSNHRKVDWPSPTRTEINLRTKFRKTKDHLPTPRIPPRTRHLLNIPTPKQVRVDPRWPNWMPQICTNSPNVFHHSSPIQNLNVLNT